MTMEQMLNASGWELSVDVKFTSADSGTVDGESGKTTFTRSLEREFSATIMLDMRNAGANLSMLIMSQSGNQAEMQRKVMGLVTRTDQIANWMHVGQLLNENVTPEQMQAEATGTNGTARLNYRRVDIGKGLLGEAGSRYDMRSIATQTGSGPIRAPTQLVLEILADSGQYILSLPHEFTDFNDKTVTIKTVTVIAEAGGQTSTDSTSRTTGFNYAVSGIVPDEAKIGEIPFMEGKVIPSTGKITGERTVKGHYTENAVDIPGTFVFRWTVIPKS
jgi:hypothetical protein